MVFSLDSLICICVVVFMQYNAILITIRIVVINSNIVINSNYYSFII